MQTRAQIRRARLGHAVPALAGVAALALLAPPAGDAGAATGSTGLDSSDPGFVAGEVVVTLRGHRAERLIELPAGVAVKAAVRALRRNGRVASASPNYIARASFLPNDPGRRGPEGGWQRDQWNFLDHPAGVRAPEAWDVLRASGHPGGAHGRGRQGVKVAVIDTGVAYRRLGRKYRRSPDLRRRSFVPGRDFVGDDRIPLDRSGHGTHVASTIAEAVDNGRAVTGLAYRARIMPVRVLRANGQGTARNVARGVRWAARHGAKVINLSLEFGAEVNGCRKIPAVCGAIRLANRRGAIIVAAAGNASRDSVAYPARVAVAVGATTARGCLALYSSFGAGLDLVAPGGGLDVIPGSPEVVPHDPGPNCRPNAARRGIVQLTLRPGFGRRRSFARFAYPYYEGTSMSAPHVSAVAALVLGSKLLHEELGRRPDPGELERHLEETACRAACRISSPALYGAGLVDAASAVGFDHPDEPEPPALRR